MDIKSFSGSTQVLSVNNFGHEQHASEPQQHGAIGDGWDRHTHSSCEFQQTAQDHLEKARQVNKAVASHKEQLDQEEHQDQKEAEGKKRSYQPEKKAKPKCKRSSSTTYPARSR
jgi:hypothetical protein